ncbi:hypothetical protein DFH08DRAFT_1085920 [Mycena albidolilacea]|uniref:Uncharacterized protein n=1 Tax=Mycena albidolilacea TaxID=1033008 RepID=A0AAD6ZFQ0_9AGAR|nr:hypothetical protein DFH08DRAFT_1085920 [Mycena albidolilacea]
MSDPATNNSASKRGSSPTRKGTSAHDTSSTETASKTTKTSSTTTKTSKSSSSTATGNTLISNTLTSSTSTRNTSSGQDLSQCTLTLRETILTIEWTGGSPVIVNLNQYVAYIGGQLRWVSRGTGGFRTTCQEKSIQLDGTVLVASCREGDSGDYQKVRLDLTPHIIFDSTTNFYRPDELEFTLAGAETIVESSRSLMDITLISTFNLSKLLREPAFNRAITEVAERAESDAHDQRLAAMNGMTEEVEEIKKEVEDLQKRLESVATRSQKATEDMKTQLESISKESTQRFEREMTTLVNALAKEAMKAVYAQIRELQVLTVEQQTAYESHWPPPPYKADATPGPTAVY